MSSTTPRLPQTRGRGGVVAVHPGVGEATRAVGIGLIALWLVEVVDTVLGGRLDWFGIHAHELGYLPGIFLAPLLHLGFGHLLANSLPFLVLGVGVYTTGRAAFWVTTVVSTLCSGAFAWLFSAPGTVTVGASGLIFGWLAFLLVRGLFNGDWRQILLACLVFAVFGGMLWGVFPTMAGISWQGHLGGAAGGVASGWLLRRR